MIKDNRISNHRGEFENVLGYKYNLDSDTLHISNGEVLQEANTKRKVLSQSSKVLDPLILCLSITVRFKILIRKFGSLNLSWDKTITVETHKTIGHSRIKYFELLTLLSDIQNAIDTRPLIYRCSFDSNLQLIILNSFLRPNPIYPTPPLGQDMTQGQFLSGV